MRRAVAILVVAGAAMTVAGPDALGRLALRAGADRVAAALLTAPATRGVALFRAGDHAGADREFAAAGRSETYNRGLSLAATGDYPLSVAYFDAVLFANPADDQARTNRDLVAAMFVPERGDSAMLGRIGTVTGGGPATGDVADPFRMANASDPDWRKPLDVKGLSASEAWLDSIGDDPGEFLRLRLKAEYDRRAALGLIRPEEGDPW